MEDVFDFYKPTLTSEYPRVDGHLSNACYLRALDFCYLGYARKFQKTFGMSILFHTFYCSGHPFTSNDFDFAVFHAPYNKLVQKSFGRYAWQDFLSGAVSNKASSFYLFRLLISRLWSNSAR